MHTGKHTTTQTSRMLVKQGDVRSSQWGVRSSSSSGLYARIGVESSTDGHIMKMSSIYNC